MSLEKAIQHGKEKRAPYYGGGRFDLTCRPHGAGRAHPCPWCANNRMARNRRWEAYAADSAADFVAGRSTSKM